MKKSRIRWELLWTFMQIGLFTFGGGYAMLPVIEDICIHRKGWISHEEMMDVTVIAESTPGPIAINCATFVGYRQAGLSGALMATLGVVLPSFGAIFMISMFLDRFLEIALIAHAFKGIKAAVAILIVNAAAGMLKKLPPAPFPRAIAVCSFGAMFLADLFSFSLSSIVLMAAAGTISLLLFIAGDAGRRNGAAGQGASVGRNGAVGQGASAGRKASVGQGVAVGQGAFVGRNGAVRQGASAGRNGAVGQGASVGRNGAVGQGASAGQGVAVGNEGAAAPAELICQRDGISRKGGEVR